jgi:hypothetical protein
MACIDIKYDEPDVSTYSGVEFSDKTTKILFFSDKGFPTDWGKCMKYLITEDTDKHVSFLSSINHFIFDGAPYDSGFLVENKDTNEWELLYGEECSDLGIEFFVPKGTKPTWTEFKENFIYD